MKIDLLPIEINSIPIIDERFVNVFDHVIAAEQAFSSQNILNFIFNVITL